MCYICDSKTQITPSRNHSELKTHDLEDNIIRWKQMKINVTEKTLCILKTNQCLKLNKPNGHNE